MNKFKLFCAKLNKCRFIDEETERGGGDYNLSCYRFIEQNIIFRDGRFYGVEILSRPIDGVLNNDYTSYFSTLSQRKNKILTLQLLYKILHHATQKEKIKSIMYFINIERILLLDSDVVDKIININNSLLSISESKLVLTITERHRELEIYTRENEYHLKDSGVQLAMGNFMPLTYNLHDKFFYDYIKISINYVSAMMTDSCKDLLIKYLYDLAENGVFLIAEKIETIEDYQLATSLPFTYFQGLFDDT
jgi:EAL domain-containing protein (putative c-di-GMP-specific phosphodiesterase class I)